MLNNGRQQEDQGASAGAGVIIATSPLQYPSSEGHNNNLVHGATLIGHPAKYHLLPASPNSSCSSTTAASASSCARPIDNLPTSPSPAHLHFTNYSSLLAHNGLYPLPQANSAHPSPNFSRSNAPPSPAASVEHRKPVDRPLTVQIRPHPIPLVGPKSPQPFTSSLVGSAGDSGYMLSGRPQPHMSHSCSSAAPSPDDCSRNSTSSSDSQYRASPAKYHHQYESRNVATGSTSSSRGPAFEKSRCTSTVVAASSQISTSNYAGHFAVHEIRGAGEELMGYGFGQEQEGAVGGLTLKDPMGNSLPIKAPQRGVYPKPTRELLLAVPMQEQVATINAAIAASKQDPGIKPAAAIHNMQSPSHPLLTSDHNAKTGVAGGGHTNPLKKSAPNASTFQKFQLGNHALAEADSGKSDRDAGANCQNYYQFTPSPPPCSYSNSSSARTSNARKNDHCSTSGNHKQYSYIARSPRSPDALLSGHQPYAETIKSTYHHPPVVNNSTSKKWDDAEKWLTANINGCKGFTSNTLRMLGKSCNEGTMSSVMSSPTNPSHRSYKPHKLPSSACKPSMQNSVSDRCVQNHGPPSVVDAHCGISNYASMPIKQSSTPMSRDHAVGNVPDSPMASSDHEAYQTQSRQEGHGYSTLDSYCNCLKVNYSEINGHQNPTKCETEGIGNSFKSNMVSDTGKQQASGVDSVDEQQVPTQYHERAMLDGCSGRLMVRSTSASSSTARPCSQNLQLSDHLHHLPRISSNGKLPHCANCGSCSWITPSASLLQKGCDARPGMGQADSLNTVRPLLQRDAHQDHPSALVQHAPLRDVSTEMTPLEGSSMTTSRYPSKCASPSRHNTPARQMRALLQHGPSSSASRNNYHAVDLTELAKCHRAKLELHALTWNERGDRVRSFNRPTSIWSSRETEEDDLSRSLRLADIDEDQLKSSWEKKDSQFKEERIQREEARIQAWENQKKAKADAQLRKLEAKLAKQRSQTTDKIMSKLLVAQRQAEEMRANVRSQKGSTKTFRARHKSHSPVSRCACFSSKTIDHKI